MLFSIAASVIAVRNLVNLECEQESLSLASMLIRRRLTAQANVDAWRGERDASNAFRPKPWLHGVGIHPPERTEKATTTTAIQDKCTLTTQGTWTTGQEESYVRSDSLLTVRVHADTTLPTTPFVVSPDRMTKEQREDMPIPHSAAPYADKGRKHKRPGFHSVTCPTLLCNGGKDIEGFKRDVALAYLTKRMTRPMVSRGIPTDEAVRNVSSAQHMYRWFDASNVEDIVQDAFIVFWKARAKGETIGTYLACKFALGEFLRQQRKQRNQILRKLDMDARTDKRERADRANRLPCEADIERLAAIVEHEGEATATAIAKHFNISQQAMSKRLAKVANRAAW